MFHTKAPHKTETGTNGNVVTFVTECGNLLVWEMQKGGQI